MKGLDIIDGSYNSPQPLNASRLLPSLRFYRRLLRILYRLGVKAKKEGLQNDDFHATAFNILKALERSGVVFEVNGVENSSVSGPCIYMPNHMSVLETFVLPGFICPYKEMTFVIKDSLLKYPVFKDIMVAMDSVVVKRVNAREDLNTVLTEGAEKLRSGKSMIIFPQSTRTLDFSPKNFNTMGIKLALRAQVPVVPVAVKSDAWRHGSILKDFGKIDSTKKVYITFGKPMTVTGRGVEEHRQSIEFISGLLEKWGVTVLQ
ncbi:MAG: 1-acyl-sn-glycerol-3-phosphate acyltransferase [Candidatus Magnetominusculus sp. LBB02]|nr:1-acyl-sn-glycerol-3-phosphate acyltransferase [Candidatus Magnetominusculus sp. LBB02]